MSRAIRIALIPLASSSIAAARSCSSTTTGRIEAWEGDTIASAMLAAGVDVFSRSFKYHRPRGLLCCEGHCPNCMMGVDGSPNVRACTEPARAGMKVIHQNAWPSPEFDVLATTGAFDFMMPVGFYYKTFFRPRFMWPQYERVIRQIAGLGRIDTSRVPPYEYDKQHLRTDVTVVGAGPAGLSAALAAAEAGVQVALVDENPFLGGHYRFQSPTSREFSEAQDLETRVARPVEHPDSRRTRRRSGSTKAGCWASSRDAARSACARSASSLASGIIERPMVFGNNDLPGVMLGRAVQRLIHLHGVTAGLARRRRRQQFAIDAGRGGSRGGRRRYRRVRGSARADRRDRRRQVAARPAGEHVPGVTSLVRARRRAIIDRRVGGGRAAGRPSRSTATCSCSRPAAIPRFTWSSRPAPGAGTTRTGMRFWLTSRIHDHFVAGDANGVHGPGRSGARWPPCRPGGRAKPRRRGRIAGNRAAGADAALVHDQRASGSRTRTAAASASCASVRT